MSKERTVTPFALSLRGRRRPRSVGMLILAAFGIVALPLNAREVSVDDILSMEGIGSVRFAPDGRIIVERFRPYRARGQEVLPFLNDRDRSELLLIDGERHAQPWFEQTATQPAWFASFSPSGRNAAVYWLNDGQVKLGLLARGATAPVSLPVSPQLLPSIKGPLWRSEDELIVIETAAGESPQSALDEAGSVRTHPMLLRGTAAAAVAPVTITNSGSTGDNRPAAGGELVSIRSDGSRRVLAEGRFLHVSISPDRRYAMAMREGIYLAPNPIKPLDSVPLHLRDIVLVDLVGGSAKVLCEGCDPGQSPPDWSPDGKELLMFDYGRTAARVDGLYSLTLDGKVKPVAPELVVRGEWAPRLMKVAAAEYSGGGMFMIGSPRSDPQARDDWYWVESKSSPVKLSGQFERVSRNLVATLSGGEALLIADNSLWRISAARQAKRLLAGTGIIAAVGETDGFGAPITPRDPQFVTLRETAADGTQTLRFVDVSTGQVRSAILPRDVAVRSADARRARAVVLARDGTLSLITAGGPSRPLLSVNEHLRDLSRPDIQKLVRKDRNGTDVVDWLIMPATRRPGPTPLVVDLYPGRVQSNLESGYELPRLDSTYGPHMLLRHGYAVLRVSVPLKQAEAGEPLAQTGREVGLALDSVLATGLVDPQRLVLYGHSFGGYGTAATLVTEKRFAAAIAMAGPMNLTSSYGQFDVRMQRDIGASLGLSGAAISENGQFAMGAPPWTDPDRYVRNSPLFQSAKIETPLLLIHGDADYIAIGQAEEMFSALYRQGKNATLLRYWGEGHFFTRPRTIEDLDKRVPAWLAARIAKSRQ